MDYFVRRPYLDEVFHVGQARYYCLTHNFSWWDPKITTPPGLYLLSYAKYLITGRCSIDALRELNASILNLSLAPIGLALYLLSNRVSTLRAFLQIFHTNANITNFPLLFFFSGLYYTDVASTFFVILAYTASLPSGHSFRVLELVAGAAALWFRQTNIFWVAVFPAGLRVAKEVREWNEASPADTSFAGVIQAAWTEAAVYDPAVGDAEFEDYIKAALSIALVAARQPHRLLLPLFPYLTLLAGFASFVAWNGGVVLGDKSNHVATIHLPQMLYLWPFMLFFSFPLIIPPFASRLIDAFRLPAPRRLANTGIFLACTGLALAAVHWNTIVHPFTLADNRHYVFYVFKILRTYPLLKYLAAPVYVVCAWATISALGHSRAVAGGGGGKAVSRAQRIWEPKVIEAEVIEAKVIEPEIIEPKVMEPKVIKPRVIGKEVAKAKTVIRTSKDEPELEYSQQQPNASFVLVWLAATALSLVSTALVEPRYCIVPWVMWRLRVASKVEGTWGYKWYDFRLVAETVWFYVIQDVTGKAFLHHGYEWASEPGAVQRFMW
ncbi:hypothetical protein EJ06DRAFT_531286 [Trichodelitschia bisporula]|uniref:Dol-P-Glc:Glc(2)Man(9)GlcNAc(2)-PP-Dol alpha-1,2-glucosyltransferase n=1 Tax=Trichodelitschia bisporula TaxID=703511 RepID=A0A6G1HSE4_9PEZI|nr:hypothetical protein EJ06DRAFT_531286 [Trichodelitschia bisporula]